MEGSKQKDRILSLDAHVLSHLLATRKITATELMEATLDQIDSHNPSLNAMISLRNRDDLLSEAQHADSTPQRAGWLHGIPIAVKDLWNVAGIRTTLGGSLLYAERPVPSDDDIFVRRLREAGAIIIGKTNSPELGVGSHTYNSLWGTTLNPYNKLRSAGGSSGGAAVALSARMLCVADGTDMMGSLRNPAGWNNVYSHRPTAGMMPVEAADGDRGDNPLPHPLSTVGPMARSPLDMALLLETMAGKDTFDSTDLPPSTDSRERRIGWLADWGGAYPMEPGILPLCESALEVFQKSGCAVEHVDPPFSAAELWRSWTTIRSKSMASNLIDDLGKEYVLREGAPIKPEVIWEVQRGLAMTEQQITDAVKIAQSWSSKAASLFQKFDILALPSAQVWPFASMCHWPKSIAGSDLDTYHRWMEVAVPVSLIGLPCVTVPAGFGDEGMPIGLQLFGEKGSDSMLLSVAQLYHEHTCWPSKRPPPILATGRNT